MYCYKFMKSKKLLCLATMLLSLGMVGCGGADDSAQSDLDKWQQDEKYHWKNSAEGNIDGDTKKKHDFVDVAEKFVDSTCTKKGTKVEKCSVCGYEKTSDVKEKDHELIADEAKCTASTCSVAGKDAKKCKNCDYTTADDLPLAAHQLGAEQVETIEEREYTTQTCSVCTQKIYKIKVNEVDLNAENLGSDGKLPTTSGKSIGWKIKLPQGKYDVYLPITFTKSSSDGKTLSERGVKVTYNDAEIEVPGEKDNNDLGLVDGEYKAVSFFSITATGNVDTMTFENPYYRLIFDVSGFIEFRPAAK